MTVGGSGGGPSVITRIGAAADNGPSTFVDAVLNEFVEETGIEVSDGARDRIVNDAVVPREEWMEGVRDGRLDADRTSLILKEALREAARPSGEPILSDDIWESLHSVVRDIHACPYPFKDPLC